MWPYQGTYYILPLLDELFTSLAPLVNYKLLNNLNYVLFTLHCSNQTSPCTQWVIVHVDFMLLPLENKANTQRGTKEENVTSWKSKLVSFPHSVVKKENSFMDMKSDVSWEPGRTAQGIIWCGRTELSICIFKSDLYI